MLTRRGTRHQPSEQAGGRKQDAGPAAGTKAGRLQLRRTRAQLGAAEEDTRSSELRRRAEEDTRELRRKS